jgi:hypothetical protein
VFVKVKVAELVDQRVRSALGGFFGSVCSSVNAANENKKKRFNLFRKIYFHGATTTTRRRWKAAELLAIEIASLGVNNLKIVTKVGL